MIPAIAPPSKWALVPPATGIVTICAAKMKAAVKPTTGMLLSSSSDCARRSAYPTTAAATIHVTIAVTGPTRPSGTCMSAMLTICSSPGSGIAPLPSGLPTGAVGAQSPGDDVQITHLEGAGAGVEGLDQPGTDLRFGVGDPAANIAHQVRVQRRPG